MPSQKSHNLRQEIQGVDCNADQTLSIFDVEIVRYQGETVDWRKAVCRWFPRRAGANHLGVFCFYIWEICGVRRAEDTPGVYKKKLAVRQENVYTQ